MIFSIDIRKSEIHQPQAEQMVRELKLINAGEVVEYPCGDVTVYPPSIQKANKAMVLIRKYIRNVK